MLNDFNPSLFSYDSLVSQVGLSKVYIGTPNAVPTGDYLLNGSTGRSLQWSYADEEYHRPARRAERVQNRIACSSLVEASATNNLPFLVVQFASQGQLAGVNDPSPYMGLMATPLMWACRRGHAGIVRFLLDHGADPTMTDENNSPPLHWALESACPEVIRALLDDERVNPNHKNKYGCDAAHTAMAHGSLLALWMILEDENIEKEKAKFEQPGGGAAAIPKRQYYQLDTTNVTGAGNSLLHYAAWRDSPSACQYLIERWGFDLNLADSLGRTPLIWASREGYTEVVECLLKAGADPYHRDEAGFTALQYTIARNHPEATKALQKMLSGAPANTIKSVSNTQHLQVVPLHSKYAGCREERKKGTILYCLSSGYAAISAISGIIHFYLIMFALHFLPPMLSYLSAGSYLFRNYVWEFAHRVPVHLDGSAILPTLVTLYSCFRGTWVTRYRCPLNLVLMMFILGMQVIAWKRLGLPAFVLRPHEEAARTQSSVATCFGSLCHERSTNNPLFGGINPKDGAVPQGSVAGYENGALLEARIDTFAAGWALQLIYDKPSAMISGTLTFLLLFIVLLVLLTKWRSEGNVIAATEERRWESSPIWRVLLTRQFDAYHPRMLDVERHQLIPTRAFRCEERDVWIEHYDSYSALLDCPISKANRLYWVLFLSVMTLYQALMFIWGSQLMVNQMRCSAQDMTAFSPKAFMENFKIVYSGSAPSAAEQQPMVTSHSIVTVLINTWVFGLPCRQTAYVAQYLPQAHSWWIIRALCWYVLPSSSAYYSYWVSQASSFAVLAFGCLALRQWICVWRGITTTEWANPVAPRVDGKLVSIVVPNNTRRTSIVVSHFSSEEEEYYQRVTPSKAHAFPPANASRYIYGTGYGFINVLLFLIGQDGRSWRFAKTVSMTNGPCAQPLLNDVPLPSFPTEVLRKAAEKQEGLP